MTNGHIAGDDDRRTDTVPDEYEGGLSTENLEAFKDVGRDLDAAMSVLYEQKRPDMQAAAASVRSLMAFAEKAVGIVAQALTAGAAASPSAKGLPERSTAREVAWGLWRTGTEATSHDQVAADVIRRIVNGKAKA